MKTDYYLVSESEADELMEAYSDEELSEEQNKEVVLCAAIDICSERARIYAIPATWEAKFKNDGSIQVTRRRN